MTFLILDGVKLRNFIGLKAGTTLCVCSTFFGVWFLIYTLDYLGYFENEFISVDFKGDKMFLFVISQ